MALEQKQDAGRRPLGLLAPHEEAPEDEEAPLAEVAVEDQHVLDDVGHVYALGRHRERAEAAHVKAKSV